MKNILKYFAPYQLFLTLKNMDKGFWKSVIYHLILFITPMLFVFLIFNSILLVISFIDWTWPHHFYFPFTGGKLQDYFDRTLLVLGLFMSIIKEI